MTTTTTKTMTLEIEKRGRKWLKARKPGSRFEMDVEINGVSGSWEPGQTVEVSGDYVEESSRYGTVIRVFPKSRADVDQAERHSQIVQWLGWVEEKAEQGYVYAKGVEKMESLGIHEYPALKERLDAALSLAKGIFAREKAKQDQEREERQQEYEAQRAVYYQQRAEVRAHRILYALSQIPRLNVPVRLNERRRDSKVVVFTGTGKPFRISEDDPSSLGSHLLGHEGERGCYCYYREATADEIADVEVDERTQEERRESWSELDRIFKNIQKEGELPPSATQEETSGERIILSRLDVLTVGGGRWFTINDWHIWAMTGNSGDGDNWEASNVSGAIAFRVLFSKKLADDIKELQGKAGLESL